MFHSLLFFDLFLFIKERKMIYLKPLGQKGYTTFFQTNITQTHYKSNRFYYGLNENNPFYISMKNLKSEINQSKSCF